MNILLVSQCTKQALTETRRILDQFAERKGERTWHTAITLEGLNTLRKLLKKTARRNTAVACHWIKAGHQTELVWIVGNLRRFNTQGAVPTHSTQRDILKKHDEDRWHCAESISLLAALAGLFHDFGKANALFQNTLKGTGKRYQPWRHEWVSLRLFCAWVGNRSDREWLTALSKVTAADEQQVWQNLYQDSDPPYQNPFMNLPPVATTVAWLILSHHHLPASPSGGEYPPDISRMSDWLTGQLTAEWNATNHLHPWTEQERSDAWCFPDGTPFRSATWRGKAQKFAARALKLPSLSDAGGLEQRFTSHMARLVLILADHHYSGLPATKGWQDPEGKTWANTCRQTTALKQRLDEHNIGVSQNALLIGRCLPQLRSTLPAITRHKGFKQRSKLAQFRWQDKACDLALSLRERSRAQGFFGINMASTGCGKTFANARIMYALADEKQGCRFSVALGLRTLTLQTGEALREKLRLENDDLAVLIGSQSVLQLHDLHYKKNTLPSDNGQDDAEAIFAEHQYVRYDGALDDGRLRHWLGRSPGLHQLLSAPVLVSTIDHLIGATEGTHGGQQIAPMLRLLTADLVLDEPDDFDINDLPALCRLVNWAGMLGCRVLLSSATLPPALVQALFSAYRAGRTEYQRACGEPDIPVNICCAWFDEYHCVHHDIAPINAFVQHHGDFVSRRVRGLQHVGVLRRGKLLAINAPGTREKDVLDSMAETMLAAMQRLHNCHHQQHASGKTLSVGLIRMANIDPLVAVARRLMQTAAPADMHIHYCVYHSQHPLAMRSHLEQCLDATLTRHDPQAIWQRPDISPVFNHPERHHLFVVLATSVAEVGRDHDYDWAIAEPSSVRSLIQLAGRIQRHRREACHIANLLILQKNRRALKNMELAYCRPGFESARFPLSSHDLSKILLPSQYQIVNAIPRVQPVAQADAAGNLAALEHAALYAMLIKPVRQHHYYAAQWWREQATWSGEQQRITPFRRSAPEELHYLCLEEESSLPVFKMPDVLPGCWKDSAGFQPCQIGFASGISPWIVVDYPQVYQHLAETLQMPLWQVGQRFGEVSLAEKDDDTRWFYHPLLGVFGAPD
ncbi:type I-F CRISPR-associated helicase Cas3f [Erwinia psidii]|uniref:Type I-F CRISPR-associated helicase Cas3 n=1 Tax=Erwinia psidii TaxID=69224 RepID=A0A3N6SI51_9GAMM|nr:type I-F CRISPR-associated helicase Cas3f [Erwinia psidii]MCX8957825.1 type I-F CRISPR-associated helicase Cas3 [Erwinia psidii]RQM38441.1 type I-F CRISPR-associated helicase Cas3 [Erwinia psidii]